MQKELRQNSQLDSAAVEKAMQTRWCGCDVTLQEMIMKSDKVSQNMTNFMLLYFTKIGLFNTYDDNICSGHCRFFALSHCK